jgi:hypothetical protein
VKGKECRLPWACPEEICKDTCALWDEAQEWCCLQTIAQAGMLAAAALVDLAKALAAGANRPAVVLRFPKSPEVANGKKEAKKEGKRGR